MPNGNFEKGPKPTELKGTELIGKFALPQWEISGFVEYIESGHKQGDMLLPVPEGAFAVRLGNEASIKQRLNVIAYLIVKFKPMLNADVKFNIFLVLPHHVCNSQIFPQVK